MFTIFSTPGRPDRAGADAALQAGRSRRIAALHHVGGRLAADYLGPVAPSELDLAGLGHPLCSGALVRLESGFLSARDILIFQSFRLAIDVCLRGMVWRWRRLTTGVPDSVARGAGGGLCVDGLRIPDRHDLARPVPGCHGAEMDDQGDLSDRQDRPRHAAIHALPRFGARGRPIFSAQGGDTQLQMAAPDGVVRSAFASLFCFGVFLSFGAHWLLVQHAQGGVRALWMQLLVSVGGILIMIGLAWLLDRAERSHPVRRCEPRRPACGGHQTRRRVMLCLEQATRA